MVGHVGIQPHPEGYYSLGYWDDPDRTRALYRGPWMTCGDLARRDADGYLWFEGRADDVIKSAGYRIGPFEVESALLRTRRSPRPRSWACRTRSAATSSRPTSC